MKRLREDLSDLQTHNDESRVGDSPFRVSGECPEPAPCAFDKSGICKVCQKKEDVHPETRTLFDLASAQDGLMPITADELGIDQWKALGEIRLHEQAKRQMLIGSVMEEMRG